MKKIILLICLFITVFLVNACQEKPNEKTPIEEFNQLLNLSYSEFEINQETTFKGVTLNSYYHIFDNGKKITYKIETLNEIEGLTNSSTTFKKVNEGTKDLENNEISLKTLKITSRDFDSLNEYSNKIIGTISNAKKYLNVDYNCNDFKLTVEFSTSIKSVDMSYTLDNGTICKVKYSNFK